MNAVVEKPESEIIVPDNFAWIIRDIRDVIDERAAQIDIDSFPYTEDGTARLVV